jgi:hypothetical protein
LGRQSWNLKAREYARLNNRSKNQEREFVWKYYKDGRVLDMAVYTWLKMLSEDRTLSLKEPSSERSAILRKLQPSVGMRP